ncbi:hypothetical protein D3C73_436220 [compost metagenome]
MPLKYLLTLPPCCNKPFIGVAIFADRDITNIKKTRKPTAPNSYKGAVKVQDIIKALAESCDYTFVNHGVDKILNDMYLVGSTINQMMDCADAADIGMTIHNGVVEISNKGGILTDIVPEVSPNTGMIG